MHLRYLQSAAANSSTTPKPKAVFRLPVKVHLVNSILGSSCYLNYKSESAPAELVYP